MTLKRRSLRVQKVNDVRDLHVQIEQGGDISSASLDNRKFIAVRIGYREIFALPPLMAFQVVGVNLVVVALVRPGMLKYVVNIPVWCVSGKIRVVEYLALHDFG